MNYKFWLDDIRPAPEGYLWFQTAESLIEMLKNYYNSQPIVDKVVEISLDNDLGEGRMEGYKVLDWLESLLIPVEFGIHIHSANPVARERMRAIVQHNGWKEVR